MPFVAKKISDVVVPPVVNTSTTLNASLMTSCEHSATSGSYDKNCSDICENSYVAMDTSGGMENSLNEKTMDSPLKNISSHVPHNNDSNKQLPVNQGKSLIFLSG
ncbi:hypothetical protein ACF0H5_019349 [Mactra antiquata]